jgi:hypothetical protein
MRYGKMERNHGNGRSGSNPRGAGLTRTERKKTAPAMGKSVSRCGLPAERTVATVSAWTDPVSRRRRVR